MEDNKELELNEETEEVKTPEEAEFVEEENKIVSKDIVSEMKDSFLEYSMSVIVARALPALRDGLKPVHRRIL